MVKVRACLMYDTLESPHKDKSRRMHACTCTCVGCNAGRLFFLSYRRSFMPYPRLLMSVAAGGWTPPFMAETLALLVQTSIMAIIPLGSATNIHTHTYICVCL